MGRRNSSTRPVESAEQSGPGMTIDPPGLLVLLSPISGPGTHLAAPGIVGDSFPKISDPYAPAVPYYKGKPLRSFFWSLSRRRVVKQLFATPTTTCNSSISLAEQDRLFNSQNIRDVWRLFYYIRAHFPRPDESDPQVRALCMEWKRKYKGNSPRSLQRFCQHYPHLAVWAKWMRRAIEETQPRATKNKSPRMDLLRQCVRILATAPGWRERIVDAKKEAYYSELAGPL